MSELGTAAEVAGGLGGTGAFVTLMFILARDAIRKRNGQKDDSYLTTNQGENLHHRINQMKEHCAKTHQNVAAHQATTDERFKHISESLEEIKGDVKGIMKGGGAMT